MNKLMFVGLCASTVGIISTPLCAVGRPGAAAPATHAAAPAPHVSAPPPHVAASPPHIAAPATQFAAPAIRVPAPAPHMAASPQHFSAPAPHFSAPAPHMAAAPQHFSAHAPHLYAPSPHMAASASHLSANQSHQAQTSAFRAATQPHSGATSRNEAPQAMHMAASSHAAQPQLSHATSKETPQSDRMIEARASNSPHMASHNEPNGMQQERQQENMSRLSQMTPQKRASEISGMSPANRTEAMQRMSPQQRAESMAHMNPEMRSQLMGKEGANGMQNIQVERSSVVNHPQGRAALMAAGAGAGAIGAISAAGMMHRNETGHPAEQSGENMSREHGAAGTARSGAVQRSIPGPPGFANPRQVNRLIPGEVRQISPTRGGALAWSSNARNIPRAGNLQTGRPGALDPGGYTRSAGGHASALINPNYASRQFAATNPNYQALTNANYRNILANRSQWPWQLPSYAPGWFNNYQNPWNWGQQNWGNNNNNNGFFGMLGNFFNPWGTNANMGWIPDLNYYNGYDWDNQNYPCDYYAPNYFCPTPYVFDVGAGQFWQPGAGYSDSLPSGYQAPITVAIQEIVPTYDQNGQISGYQPQTFDYNAFWDPNEESYGYYDYRQQFHWLTFPWLNSWSGANAQNVQMQSIQMQNVQMQNQQVQNQQSNNPQTY